MTANLTDLPEPVMAQFDRLPLAMQMRVAARVMDEVNRIYRERHPESGNSQNEPISPSSMRYLADQWEFEMVKAKLPWPGYCQSCGSALTPPDATSCRSCGADDIDD